MVRALSISFILIKDEGVVTRSSLSHTVTVFNALLLSVLIDIAALSLGVKLQMWGLQHYVHHRYPTHKSGRGFPGTAAP